MVKKKKKRMTREEEILKQLEAQNTALKKIVEKIIQRNNNSKNK